MFQCPKCSSTKLYEHEIGPTITREIQRIDSQYCCAVYKANWQSTKLKKWWTCGGCGWKLPVVGNIDELIAYLEKSIP